MSEASPLERLVSRQLLGDERTQAQETLKRNHYTRSVPSGKSHYVQFGDAIVVWSIPANKNIARFILGWEGNVWELSRLWAPDGHEKNLLTQAISAAVKVIVKLEKPDALVSYADPNAGHKGGVYRAASWIYHGKSEEVRTYRAPDGTTVARRAFHSGRKGLRKAEIEALGYREEKLPGKERFVRPISKRAKRTLTANKFCEDRGLVMVPLSIDTIDGVTGRNTPSATLVFRALQPGDPEIKRVNIEAPDNIQRIQRR